MLLLENRGLQFLPRHHFPFLYKNNVVPPRVLTAHQIPLTVFLPSSAYFYSSGYFILGLCEACFGRAKLIVLFLAARLARERFSEEAAAGRVRFWGLDLLLGVRSPGPREPPGGVSSQEDPIQLGWQPRTQDTGSACRRKYYDLVRDD